MWITLGVALVVAMLFAVPVVWLAGWRRPGGHYEESAVPSGVFLFVLVFVTTWALAGWLAPWGPVFSGVSWLLVLIGAAFVTLLVLVAAPIPSRQDLDERSAAGRVEEAGIGVLFWALLVLLLLLGIIGNATPQRLERSEPNLEAGG